MEGSIDVLMKDVTSEEVLTEDVPVDSSVKLEETPSSCSDTKVDVDKHATGDDETDSKDNSSTGNVPDLSAAGTEVNLQENDDIITLSSDSEEDFSDADGYEIEEDVDYGDDEDEEVEEALAKSKEEIENSEKILRALPAGISVHLLTPGQEHPGGKGIVINGRGRKPITLRSSENVEVISLSSDEEEDEASTSPKSKHVKESAENEDVIELDASGTNFGNQSVGDDIAVAIPELGPSDSTVPPTTTKDVLTNGGSTTDNVACTKEDSLLQVDRTAADIDPHSSKVDPSNKRKSDDEPAIRDGNTEIQGYKKLCKGNEVDLKKMEDVVVKYSEDIRKKGEEEVDLDNEENLENSAFIQLQTINKKYGSFIKMFRAGTQEVKTIGINKIGFRRNIQIPKSVTDNQTILDGVYKEINSDEIRKSWASPDYNDILDIVTKASAGNSSNIDSLAKAVFEYVVKSIKALRLMNYKDNYKELLEKEDPAVNDPELAEKLTKEGQLDENVEQIIETFGNKLESDITNGEEEEEEETFEDGDMLLEEMDEESGKQ